MQQTLTSKCTIFLRLVPYLVHKGCVGGDACIRESSNRYIMAYAHPAIAQHEVVSKFKMYYSPNTLLSSLTFRLSLSYKRRARLSGWRGGFVLAVIGSSLVLLFNIVCAIVAAAMGETHDGIATIFTGNCIVASRLTTGLQLHINILSSSLLGASSYCLQQLGAPTRKEIDRAHGKGKWLDVGVLSLRNLPNISKRRQVAWLLLAMSSIPLHFL